MIDILIDDGVADNLPSSNDIERAIQAACHAAKVNIAKPQVCVRFAHDHEVQRLNAQWRNHDKVTDVLSFPMQEGGTYNAEQPLGDIILALPFVHAEAERLHIDIQAHILHLIVHSTLHLLGYDHIETQDAATMQALECAIMQTLHLHLPYPDGICHHA